MTTARERVAAFWDQHVQQWLDGRDPMADPLPEWYASFQGTGLGAVTRDGFPEPYIGDLTGLAPDEPVVVVLGLNPGKYFPEFQSRTGTFAEEIRRYGSYRSWAASGPYLRDPWQTRLGDNKYWRDRRAFARRWLHEPTLTERNLLVFECYPWHSTKVTGSMKPPADIIRQFVFEPIGELATDHVFAFGKPWLGVAESLDLPPIVKLGLGGIPYGSNVGSRAVRVFALPSGQRLVVEWHLGSSGPPSSPETELLRWALSDDFRPPAGPTAANPTPSPRRGDDEPLGWSPDLRTLAWARDRVSADDLARLITADLPSRAPVPDRLPNDFWLAVADAAYEATWNTVMQDAARYADQPAEP
ncbi:MULTISPECIES: anti-phage DNA glycosylase Brig1 [unclassified Solwaraspora]|uniref:anti-phage DNA glycosylase Brig1 n=1 Tax=unclassified Solwaraspora TaxID=2627926 RepID=UPI00259B9ED8|nr:hypothetical protein [Solwaraspora sp. WMMA2056]WJK39258.1 hypothetical protein O7608_22690 [Solwaraspora sp. WMMA2056]